MFQEIRKKKIGEKIKQQLVPECFRYLTMWFLVKLIPSLLDYRETQATPVPAAGARDLHTDFRGTQPSFGDKEIKLSAVIEIDEKQGVCRTS